MREAWGIDVRSAPSPATASVSFGPYTFDPSSGELRKLGQRVKIRPQAAKVLTTLCRRPKELVTRDELRQQIWGESTFVDFEHGLNFCIRQLRAALNDDAENPRYIETLPRHGYRFLAAVQTTKADRRATIAVLPFENLSGDSAQEHLSDGLTEEMITQLGRLDPDHLGVIARTSVMKYKNARRGLHAIAREMAVDYVLEGSVRRQGNRIRVAAQLIRISDQTHLWAESYDRSMSDLLGLQADVARAVAAQIDLKLSISQQARLGRGRDLNPEAHEAYMRGRLHLRKMTREDAESAIKYFRQALAIEPGYAMAYAGIADANISVTSWHNAPLETMPKAREAALKALELEPDLAHGHALLGAVHLLFDWEWKEAEREFGRAIELDANLADGHVGYAALLTTLGRFDEALRELRIAQSLDPMSPSLHSDELWMWFGSRHYDQAIEECRRWLEVDPGSARAYWTMALAYSYSGKHVEAIKAGRRGVKLSESPFASVGLAEVYARSDNTQQARQVLKRLESDLPNKYVCGYNMAAAYAALGDKDKAFESLERAFLERSD